VLVEVTASGVTPGDHPVGLYEVGVCEPGGEAGGDFASAGALVMPVEDLSDLPAMVVGDDAVGRMSSLVDDVDLEDLLEGDGTALVVHPVADAAVPPEEARASRVACAEFTR
jgi:Cu-Zn family superoxide dismutase